MSAIVVISGSIASGKSTLARAVATELQRIGVAAAVIDIDVLHDMLPVDLDPTWTTARPAAGSLAQAFLSASVQVVVVDGEFITPAERSSFLERVALPLTARFVTLRVGYDEALKRARSDPARGVSRNPAFLADHYANVEAGLDAAPDSDLVIHTDEMDVTEATNAILAFVSEVL